MQRDRTRRAALDARDARASPRSRRCPTSVGAGMAAEQPAARSPRCRCRARGSAGRRCPLAATSSSWSCVVDRDVRADHRRVGRPGRSGTARRAPRPRRLASTAPGRTIAQRAGRARRRADRRPSTASRAARRRRSPGRRRAGSSSGTSSSRAGLGPAGAVGARLQHRPAHARERRHRPGPAARASPGRRRTRAGSAAPGWAAARVTAPGSSRAQRRRACRGPSSGSAASASSRSKNITAEGLSRRRRLSA